MKFVLLQSKKTDIREFIDFWSQFYMDSISDEEQKKEKKYSDNINNN